MQANDNHASGLVGLGITVATWLEAWLEVVDITLRIVLSLVGVAAGVYTLLYYRHKWLREKQR